MNRKRRREIIPIVGDVTVYLKYLKDSIKNS
jgi:hypothetical protein